MTYFTDSPYEGLMRQRPKTKETPPFPAQTNLPHHHPCHQCPYTKVSACLGFCYRQLSTPKKGR